MFAQKSLSHVNTSSQSRWKIPFRERSCPGSENDASLKLLQVRLRRKKMFLWFTFRLRFQVMSYKWTFQRRILQTNRHRIELALQNDLRTPWIKIFLRTLERNSVRVQQKRRPKWFSLARKPRRLIGLFWTDSILKRLTNRPASIGPVSMPIVGLCLCL